MTVDNGIKIKGLKQDKITEAIQWVKQAVAENQDENAVQMGLINLGIPINKVVPLYNQIGKAEGFIKSKEQMEKEVDDALATEDIGALCASYDHFQTRTAELAKQIGVTEGKVRYEVGLLAKEQGIKRPVKPTGGGQRVGEVSRTFIRMFNENPTPKRDEVYAELAKLDKVKNIKSYISSLFIPFYAIANKMDVEAAIEATKEDKLTAGE